jgi:alpha-ketoglutarate-dependent taurine dioxygenase
MQATDTLGQIIASSTHRDLADLEHKAVIEQFFEYGAVLFRGFGASTEEFLRFTEGYCDDFSTYQGGGFRFGPFNRVAYSADGTLMSTTGASQGFPIPLHGEMYYLAHHPDVLWFYCDVPPEERGETTLCNGAELYRQLSLSTRELLSQHEIRYGRTLPDKLWQTAFQTDNLQEVIDFCAANQTVVELDPKTKALQTYYQTSPVQATGKNNELIFINNLLVAYFAEQAMRAGWGDTLRDVLPPKFSPLTVRLDDGREISKAVIAELTEVGERLTVDVSWQRGDIVMVDNRRTLHGRRECGPGPRKICVRMGELLDRHDS